MERIFGPGSGPRETNLGVPRPIFGRPPSSTTTPPPAMSSPAAPPSLIPQPRPHAHPHIVPSQPWRQPQGFGNLNDMPFTNQSSIVPGNSRSPSSWSPKDLNSPDVENKRLELLPHLITVPKISPSTRKEHPLETSQVEAVIDETPLMTTKSLAPKRNRSPPLPSHNVPDGISHPADMNSEREMQAKARRLARFHAELSQPSESSPAFSRKSSLSSGNDLIQTNKVNFPVGDSTKKAGDALDGSSDYEPLVTYTAIRGLCPDMCPESERGERERKGDLDKYERLDGERNQTSVSLAVKKYTRTAERDALLIRPLPVLQMTVDYLLDLLNQPYDEQFLGLYNFLWDRMRAVRMDLRMQHIFNHEAISMLEQMIRLHIIAMHELSEHKKGEGFSEGFDAHLNIEQMNKTSVELFQMYDDHRKRGIIIPTEKEFRGYYALLKLDKHPGYKVEPAELSLDLAKMTSEIRCTSQIVFARDVARACRTSNFIAFFRHARKATYLQACLMHAHFSKLRTQALASLHSGLQNGQGIPVSHVVKWLGMEGEDIGSLLEYHGFSTRRFEEPYMVKEGSFLNCDVDYPTKCSQLVKLKRSKRIVDDICHDQTLLSPNKEQEFLSHAVDAFENNNVENHITEAHFQAAANYDMLDYEVTYASNKPIQLQMMDNASLPASNKRVTEDEMGDEDVDPIKMLEVAVNEPLYCPSLPSDSGMQFEAPVEIVALDVEEEMQVKELGKLEPGSSTEHSQDDQAVSSCADGDQLMHTLHKNEAAQGRMRLILRIWKRRASSRREMRERRQSLADAALSMLPFGLPLQQNEASNRASGSLNVDYVIMERHLRHEKSWSALNVSAVVAPILREKNHLAKCLWWKLVLCLQADDTTNKQHQLLLSWLRQKLMGTGGEHNDELVVYSSDLSIWKQHDQVEIDFLQSSLSGKSVKSANVTIQPTNGQNQELLGSCYSIVREVNFNNSMPIIQDGSMVGLSAVIFLIAESIPWSIQKSRLHQIVSLIPSGSSLPLLILSSNAPSFNDCYTVVSSNLGLQELDKMTIRDYSVVFLNGNESQGHINSFFSDDHLEGGLRWLAENSSLQPCLRQIKTRDLILAFFNSLLAVQNVKISTMGPDHCITLFNEALDRSMEELRFAADMNKSSWPGPEVDLFKDLPYGFFVVNMLPSRQWISGARIEPLIAAIGSCKLPNFPDGLSSLRQGFDGGSDITIQKLVLEQCLCGYLADSVGLKGGNLAAREASVMVQKNTGLELRGKHYYIVPRWLEIFRRIFHWRLTNLSSGKLSSAYVLASSIPDLAGHSLSADMRRHSLIETMDLEGNSGTRQFNQLQSAMTQLTLDELIEMSCSFPPSVQHNLVSKVGQASECSSFEGLNTSVEDMVANDTSVSQDLSSFTELKKNPRYADIRHRVDELNTLLEKCSRQQNRNNEKLAVYF